MTLLQYPKNATELFQATKQLADTQRQAIESKRQIGFLVTGENLETILTKQNEQLYKEFVKVALASDVMMCCRVTPKQKQEVVAFVKAEKPNLVTLSIGDGANDVNMITEAHVGVGIKGVEGQQAARAADFSIGEFKLLRRIMFFHGRESYRKNSNLVLYNFFKNVLLNFPNFWFGYYNLFSGQTAYEEVGYQLFNLFYTSLPIGIYALFDRQTSDTVLLKDPKYYAIGPRHIMFNVGRFIRWFAWAILYSFLVTTIAIWLFDYNFAIDSGKTFGFFISGQVVFVVIVMVSNLKICSFANSYSLILVILLIGSAALGFLTWYVVNFFELGSLEHTFTR